MHRLVEAAAVSHARGRQEAERAGQHRGFVAEDVAEHVAGEDHVELARVADDLHRRAIHVHVVEADLRIVGRQARDHLAPELRRLQDVRLVHRKEQSAPPAGGLERHPRDALDLAHVVTQGVDADPPAVLLPDAARFAVVDAAGELAHDEEVRSLDGRGPEGGAVEHPDHLDRAQVRVGAEHPAQFQQRTFGTLGGGEHVVARIPDRPQQDRPRAGAGGPRLLGEPGARAVPGDSREVVALHLQAVARTLRHPLQYALRRGYHVGADPVPGKTNDGQIHGGRGW